MNKIKLLILFLFFPLIAVSATTTSSVNQCESTTCTPQHAGLGLGVAATNMLDITPPTASAHTSALQGLNVAGGAGGTAGSSTNAGNGSAITLATGTGGASGTAGLTAGTGGNFAITTGGGGSATTAGAISNYAGTFSVTLGTSGSSATGQTPRAGSSGTLTAGNAGSGSQANGAAGGAWNISGGVGSTGATIDTGGVGGAIAINGGTGGAGGTGASGNNNGGAGGDITLTPGSGGAGGGTGSAGATGKINLAGNISITDADNIAVGTSTGTKIGTSTSQKIGFYNTTPVVQPTGDALTALGTLGLVGSPTLSASDIGLGTTSTPQFAGLGLGTAADATNLLYISSTVTPIEKLISSVASNNAEWAIGNTSSGNTGYVRIDANPDIGGGYISANWTPTAGSVDCTQLTGLDDYASRTAGRICFELGGGTTTSWISLQMANQSNANLVELARFRADGNIYFRGPLNTASGTAGVATLSSGSAVVSTSYVTSSSSIMLSYKTKSATTLGALYVSAVSAGTSFTIASTGAVDNSTVSWFLVN